MHGIIIIDKFNDRQNAVAVETPKLGASTATGGKNEQWKPGTLGVIINQYKRICTINARKINPNFAWQSRFHDIIIRNDRAFKTISNYIIRNPAKWLIRPISAYQPQFYSSLIGMAKNGIFAFLNNFNETLSIKRF